MTKSDKTKKSGPATKLPPSKKISNSVKKSTAKQKTRVEVKQKRKTFSSARFRSEPPSTIKYMSKSQQNWFQNKLEGILVALEKEAMTTAKNLKQQEKGLADEFDRAHNELAFVVDLRENERISNLQDKINHALRQIASGLYGFCDDCGTAIGIDRMTARPVATKCIDCKQFQENLESNAN